MLGCASHLRRYSNINCEFSQKSPHGISNNSDVREDSDFGLESKKYLLR